MTTISELNCSVFYKTEGWIATITLEVNEFVSYDFIQPYTSIYLGIGCNWILLIANECIL